MKTFLQVAAFVLLLASPAIAQDIPWKTNTQDAIKQASKDNQLVMLHFYADWCRPCKNLERFVFNSPGVVRAITEHVIPVKIDVDLHPDLVKKYGVTSVPMDVCIAPTGRVVKKMQSPRTSDGYIQMVSQLKFINPSQTSNALEDEMQRIAAKTADTEKTKNLLDFTPEKPSHSGPNHTGPNHAMPTNTASALVRSGKPGDSVKNQFARNEFATSRSNQMQTKPETNSNQFESKRTSSNDSTNQNQNDFSGLDLHQTRRAEPKRILNDRFFAKPKSLRPTTENTQTTEMAASSNPALVADQNKNRAKLAIKKPVVSSDGNFQPNSPISNSTTQRQPQPSKSIPSQFDTSSNFAQQQRMMNHVDKINQREMLANRPNSESKPAIPMGTKNSFAPTIGSNEFQPPKKIANNTIENSLETIGRSERPRKPANNPMTDVANNSFQGSTTEPFRTSSFQSPKIAETSANNQFAVEKPMQKSVQQEQMVVSPEPPVGQPEIPSHLLDENWKSNVAINSKTMPPATNATNQLATQSDLPSRSLQKNEPNPEIRPQSNQQPSVDRVKTTTFAMHGKCPVTLIQQGKWVDGDKRFGCNHRGKTFLFQSELALTIFKQDPDKYSPILAGFDPVIYHEKGELIDGKETHGVFMGKMPNQRVVLFNSVESLLKFQQSPRKYLGTVRQAMNATDARDGSRIIR